MLTPSKPTAPKLPDRFAYLLGAPCPYWLKRALAELGQHEVAGAKSNPRILEYRRLAHLQLDGEDSVVPWCAIFVNAMLAAAGVPGSGSAMARSFLHQPNFRSLAKPALGAVAVKESPSRGAASGHVGFYLGEDGLFVYLCGGNQGDAVTLSAFRKSEFLGWRWPADEPLPAAPWDGPHRLAMPKRKTAALATKPVSDA